MCYSMIVVDDEKIIREGISSFINKSNCGFTVEATFEDGETALEYLKAHRTDLVLTDICMMEMNGLDLVKYINESMYECEIIILSGYREFEYAKKALDYGVMEYLLKPIKNNNLLQSLEKAKRKLKKRAEYDEMLVSLRKKFFIDVIFGSEYTLSEMKKDYAAIGLGVEANKIYVSILKIELPNEFIDNKYLYNKDELQKEVNKLFCCNIGYLFSMCIDENRFLIVSENAVDYKDEIMKWAKDFLGTEIDFICEYQGYGLEELAKFKETMVKELENKVEQEQSVLLCTFLSLEMYDEAHKQFVDIIKRSEEPQEMAAELIALVFDVVMNGEGGYDCYKYCMELRQGKVAPDDAFDICIKAIVRMKLNEDKFIKKVKKFVKENYSDNITLETAASKLYFHPVYMSRAFKKREGKSFSEYLLEYRMTKAIDLLKSRQYKVKDVSKMVGYRNEKYFSKQFKKYTGKNPNSYHDFSE